MSNQSSNAGWVYPRRRCRYCKEEIGENAFARHEAKCEHRTPEQRATSNYARRYAQEHEHSEQPAKQRCPHCAAEIVGMLYQRHVTDCAHRTPEQREVLTIARERERAKRTRPADSPRTERASTLCPHCEDEIANTAYYAQHIARCATQTPEQRETAKRFRGYKRESRDNKAAALAASAPPLERKHLLQRRLEEAARLNGHGRRLHATISVDFERVRDLLLELGPFIAIDKIEIR